MSLTQEPPAVVETGAPSRRRTASARAILWAVGFSVFVAADDLTVVSTMLRPIITDLGLVLPDGLDDAAWIVNAYLIAFVAIMPIAGRISDVIGRRRTFLLAYAVFVVGTVWIPLATSLPALLIGRMLTAIGGGAMVPVALAVVGDVYPAETRARALGTLGAIETMGWVWGPLYGALLVRFLSWRWQFWLNVPLAAMGSVLVWWALRDHDQRDPSLRVDWIGAMLLTTALVALNLALLGGAEVQSVQGLDELTGNGGTDLRMLYPVAAAAAIAFAWHQRRRRLTGRDTMIDTRLWRGRSVRVALIVNLILGAALVIAMVDVPLFVNAVEVDLRRSAVLAGWLLSALTVLMAIGSYLGGRITERTWYGPPIVAGLAVASSAYLAMGVTWDGRAAYPLLAVQLALLGVGFGLTLAPTTTAVVDHAEADARGAAAGVVLVVRMVGLSVGLSALTAWGLARFNALRGDVDLPPFTDPDFADAVAAATRDLTARAIADTFLASAAGLAVGLVVSIALLRRRAAERRPRSAPDDGGGWMTRRLGASLLVVGLLTLVAIVSTAVLAAQHRSTRAELAATRDALATTRADLERVEAGAALFASQLTGFTATLDGLGPSIGDGLDEAIAGLEEFATSTIDFEVTIDETIVIDQDVAIERTVAVPISTSIPIETEIDTTIIVNGPFGIDLPLDIVVPVDIEVPVDVVVDIPIDETIPIGVEVPVRLDVPIAVDVQGTELETLTESLIEGLRAFQQGLGGLTGG